MRTAVIAIALIACGKTDKAAPSAGSAEGSAPAPGGNTMPAELASWMPKDAAQAWQGAWFSRMILRHQGMVSMAGDPVAIDLKGDKATAFDGTTEHALGFAIHAPCDASFSEKMADGATYKYGKQFAIANGKVVVGDGAVGYRKGQAAIACLIGSKSGVYTLDDKGTCVLWDDFMGRWDKKPATCAWSGDVLTIGDAKLHDEGGVLMDDQFKESTTRTERVADYAAAKAKVAADLAEHPVTTEGKLAKAGARAKAAGGKVGDLATVLGLVASVGADPKLKGKEVAITGYIASITTGTSGSNTSWTAILSGDASKTDVTVSCLPTIDPMKLGMGTKVTAKGTIDFTFDEAGLSPCTLAKAK